MQQIDDTKDREKKSAEDAMYETLSRLSTIPTQQKDDGIIDEDDIALGPSSAESKMMNISQDVGARRGGNKSKPTPKPVPTQTSPQGSALSSVRAPAIVKFKHTPRIFKTPIRESTQLQEEAFIAKNRPYLKANKYFNSETSDLGDSDPTWLKRKGDEYYHGGDYLAAINVYSTIIEKDDTFLRAYTNRSACYLLIDEPGLCIHDCTQSLLIMGSGSASLTDSEDKIMRAKILIRMGTAHCQLDHHHHLDLALGCLQEAATIDKTSESLKVDIERLKNVIKSYECKRDADIALGKNELDSSINLYSKAISVEGTMLKAYVNRAGAYFLSAKYSGCIQDSTHVLDALKRPKIAISTHTTFATFGLVPHPGSDLRADLVRTCLCRRAAAYEHMDEIELASKDISLATQLFGESCSELVMDDEKLNDRLSNA